MNSTSRPVIDDEQLTWQHSDDGTLSFGSDPALSMQPTHLTETTQPPPALLAPWTRRIIDGEASLTDVPECNVLRIVQKIKAYADHFPDVGGSATVRRLVDNLQQVEVGLDG